MRTGCFDKFIKKILPAKIQVTSMITLILIQTAFHAIQFILSGAGIGLVYGKNAAQ